MTTKDTTKDALAREPDVPTKKPPRPSWYDEASHAHEGHARMVGRGYVVRGAFSHHSRKRPFRWHRISTLHRAH
jgi:hypothetical protein